MTAGAARPNTSIDFTKTLEEGISNYPFNNIATTCRLMGEADVPELFGGDCYEQVTRMIDRIRKAGVEALYIASGYHFGILVPGNEGMGTYLDPTLSMRQPISLEDLKNGESKKALTFPVLLDTPSRIEASLDGETLLSNWHTPLSDGKGGVRWLPRPRQKNAFNLAQATDDIGYNPNVVKGFFKTSVRSLSWNSTNTDTGEVVTLGISPRGISLRSSHMKSRPRENTPEFEKYMEDIAVITGVSRTELDEFLELATAKFRELKEGR